VGASVLVVANELDIHAKAACSILRSDFGVEAITLDIARFPAIPGVYRQEFCSSFSVVGDAVLDDVRSVWWRRPSRCSIPSSVDPSHDNFRQSECDDFIQGLLWSLDVVWINDPGAQHVASRKVVQLETAIAIGLPVPETLITNDPAAAADFFSSRQKRTIYKRTGTGSEQFTETRLMKDADLSRLAAINLAPTTFQEFIEAECDLRVVWVAGEALAVRIDSQAGVGWVDSRLDNSVAFEPYELPARVSELLNLLMRKLGLAFGVIDLRVSAVDGQIYFLEVNPQGQFAYLEIKSGLPIFQSLAALLAGVAPLSPATKPAPVDSTVMVIADSSDVL
jgi:hypothetical protein